MKKSVFFGLVLGMLSFSVPGFSSDAMVQVLSPLTTGDNALAISRLTVRGRTAEAMLRDYAERVKGYRRGEYTLKMRMSVDDFPAADDGVQAVGLARIIDVAELAANPLSSLEGDELEARTRQVQDLLFQVRDLGGKVGIESDNWSTCGVTFPGVIILDTRAKEVLSLSPANTTC